MLRPKSVRRCSCKTYFLPPPKLIGFTSSKIANCLPCVKAVVALDCALSRQLLMHHLSQMLQKLPLSMNRWVNKMRMKSLTMILSRP